ncbi:MAG TPA: SRPBCC family protein [Chthoniobacterales bacterium]|nr:SRPBCC family protein [Chthoniobacterales bacterium]
MQPSSVVHSTIVIERSYPKPPERVFAALADPAKKRRWFAEAENQIVDEFEMEFRVGGIERLRYRLEGDVPVKGIPITSEARYQDIVPNQRVVAASTTSVGNHRISASLVTIELLPTENGTDLILTYQGAFFEGADGPQSREAGFRKLLDRLATELAR